MQPAVDLQELQQSPAEFDAALWLTGASSRPYRVLQSSAGWMKIINDTSTGKHSLKCFMTSI